MFSEYCQEPFTVEPVDVVYEATGDVQTFPDLSNRQVQANVRDIETMIFGNAEPIDLSAERMCALCDKMQLAAEHLSEKQVIQVQVPPTRADILHAVDVIEDVAIAYGYNNIPKTVPRTMTCGSGQAVNNLTDSLRNEISRAGYIELLTHGLCSTDENFSFLNHPDDGKSAVILSNPATIEFEVVRTTLIPGVLKTVQNNKSMSMKDGLKLFEISDVVILDPTTDVGARNERHLCAIYTGHTDGFEVIHGLIDRVMQLLGISCVLEAPEKSANVYEIVPTTGSVTQPMSARIPTDKCADPLYFPGRCAEIRYYKSSKQEFVRLGTYGVVHPSVLKNYQLVYPCSIVELDIGPLV